MGPEDIPQTFIIFAELRDRTIQIQAKNLWLPFLCFLLHFT